MKFLLYLGPSPLLMPKANLIQSSSQFYYLKGYFDKFSYVTISLLGKSKTSRLLSSCSPLSDIPFGVFMINRLPLFRGIFMLNAFYQIIFCLAIIVYYKLKNFLSHEKNHIYNIRVNFFIYIFSSSWGNFTFRNTRK